MVSMKTKNNSSPGLFIRGVLTNYFPLKSYENKKIWSILGKLKIHQTKESWGGGGAGEFSVFT